MKVFALVVFVWFLFFACCLAVGIPAGFSAIYATIVAFFALANGKLHEL